MINWALVAVIAYRATMGTMVRRREAYASSWAWAFLWLAGCAHDAAEERQLADLSRGLDHDQKVIDREVPRIESDTRARQPPMDDSAPNKRDGRGVMSLDVGRDPTGGAGEAGDDPNDTTPRPVIRVVGVRRTQRGGRTLDQIEETLPEDGVGRGDPATSLTDPAGPLAGGSNRTRAAQPAALDADAKRSYDLALALVKAHQFDEAIEAFAAFLVRWPDHPNADNAMYWRGESYYAKGEFARAAEEFEGTTLRFPLGNKVPDSLLKLGLCQMKLGNRSKAKIYLDRLVHDFPRSEAARLVPSVEKTSGAGPEEN
jgi:tol-pal system protein YbgF